VIEDLDRLMIVMDTLWLTGVLTNKRRAQGAYDWRLRVLRAGRAIIDLERRARASAQARGKGEELAGVESAAVAEEGPPDGLDGIAAKNTEEGAEPPADVDP
jgi:hypothetical protein